MVFSEIQTLHLEIVPTVDGILAGEGMDPAVVRGRRPILAEKAEQALAEGLVLVEGVVFFRTIENLQKKAVHEDESVKTLLEVFAGQKFTPQTMVVMACTIGRRLELEANRVINDDRLLGLALEGLANDAINKLSVAATAHFRDIFCKDGALACWMIAPGMPGWERDEGQKVLFGILQPPIDKIELLPAGQMLPLKSLSGVIGFGQAGKEHPAHCAECQVRETCPYQHLHSDLK